MTEERAIGQVLLIPKGENANRLAARARAFLGLETGRIVVGELYEDVEEAERFAEEVLCDPHRHNAVFESIPLPGFYHTIIVSKRPGVTDDEGESATRALAMLLGRQPCRQIRAKRVFWIQQGLAAEEIDQLCHELLGNPLIHEFSEQLSRERNLCLNKAEMEAIRTHFGQRPITDCELEILAQTWSEHCKHKEFNARILYRDLKTGEERVIDSLFKTKIKGATDKLPYSWLVKVFSDNAGIVRLDPKRYFVWKVETHNSPSALDPYGGAITGILGNMRDALGTGVGGARLLFNTNVLCFAEPIYDKPLLKGQLHPRRVLSGVVEGIMDGGNKSGVPTVNGSIHFDDRYAGKPLVFCGSGAILPEGRADKPIDPGDAIVMAGGRVGKDGIHGATLSSTHLDSATPATMVQIGSPRTQKLLFDFLEEACRQELIKSCTDNGAGGLSSSVGEMAELAGGARVHLERVPMKYEGLEPWEIFLSESQERMTLVVAQEKLQALLALSRRYKVECTDIGHFTDSGKLEVFFEARQIAALDLKFLHHGVPQKQLVAEWRAPRLKEPSLGEIDLDQTLLRLLAAPNICSREPVIRRYDHEVKGKTIVKPLMRSIAPQDAAVMRLDFSDWAGVIVSNGICPHYGDIDPYQMAAGAFDEAVRQIIAAGGELPSEAGPAWSACDNFCMPSIEGPDGRLKLAKLVQMCDALYDCSLAYGVPMTSGKDSMKNDFRDGDRIISVPPTLLFSMVAGISDVRRATTAEFKLPGSLIYLLGETRNELGASQLYRLFGELGANVPRVNPKAACDLYRRVAKARPLLLSCHDLSDGGLAVALAESAFGGDLGASIALDAEQPYHLATLFSESHSRFVATVRTCDQAAFEAILGERCQLLGRVTEEERLRIDARGETIVDLPLKDLKQAWRQEWPAL